MSQQSDVLIVGAGVVGLSLAWRCAQRGLSVQVVERDTPGAGATPVAAGILSPTESEAWSGDLGRFNRAAMDGWAAYAQQLSQESGLAVHHQACGVLRLARSDDDLRSFEPVAQAQQEAGRAWEWLDQQQCLQLEPGLAGELKGLWLEGECAVDTTQLIPALLAACAHHQVMLRVGVEPQQPVIKAGRLRGLRLSDGTTLSAEHVVLASGSWAGQSSWLPEALRPPVTPLLGEMVLAQTDPHTPLCTRVLRTVNGSIAPRADGLYWIGTTVRAAGFEARPNLGGLSDILNNAIGFLPGLRQAQLVRCVSGLRPATPDSLPLVGETDLKGLLMATGHRREGILHAPLTAQAVTGMICGDPPTEYIQQFDPRRFREAPSPRGPRLSEPGAQAQSLSL